VVKTARSLATALAGAVAMLQPPSSPLLDKRLPVSTLLREDIFAGFMEDDIERFSRGEKNIEYLLERRPEEKPMLLAWQGGSTMFRAVRALENNQPDTFRQKYQQAQELFAQAKQLGPSDLGVNAAIGGAVIVLGDRLPKEFRAAAWSQAYDSYQALWKFQAQAVSQLPQHLRGELLGGLAQSAQRTGRTQESVEYIDKILSLLPGTPYEAIAKRWKDDPATAIEARLTCLSCHAPGRLAARLAALQ
jgi:tetratricopeptide (TPR) repeat protein